MSGSSSSAWAKAEQLDLVLGLHPDRTASDATMTQALNALLNWDTLALLPAPLDLAPGRLALALPERAQGRGEGAQGPSDTDAELNFGSHNQRLSA